MNFSFRSFRILHAKLRYMLFFRYLFSHPSPTNCSIGHSFNFANLRNVRIGNKLVISDYVWFNIVISPKSCKYNLILGDNCYIGRFCQVNAYCSVIIGNDVTIADNVLVSDADHLYWNEETSVLKQGYKLNKVAIGNNVWIGRNCCILPGVEIGDNSVIAANSVVNKDIPDWALAAGSPAKIIKRYRPANSNVY